MSEDILAAAEVVNELPWPAEMYGIVFLVVFGALGWVTYSYRNVANRHRHKTQGQSTTSAHH
jgi:heme/copper-type cytochrome/quinol oxidase subunit 2